MKPKTKLSQKKHKVVTKSGRIVNLTHAQKAYADGKLAHPDKSLIAVAKEAYPNAKDNTLSQLVNHNEKNKDISIYSSQQAHKASLTVVELMDSKKEDVRFRAATDILDRTYGKATQKQVTQNTNINLNIEASKELSDDFTAYLKAKTAT